MQIVIVEDDVLFAENVMKTLEEFFARRGDFFSQKDDAFFQEEFSLLRGEKADIQYLDGPRLLKKLENGQTWDLCLLDVEMPGMDGIALGEKIRGLNREIGIVYLTAYEKYAYRSYRVKADDYVLKGDYRKALPPVLMRILKEKQKRREEYYTVQREREGYRIRISDIICLEKDKKITLFRCLEGRRYQEREPLESIFRKLPQERFAYIEKGIVVNMEHVKEYNDRRLIMWDGTEMQVSRRRWAVVKEKLYAFWGAN